MDPSLPSSSRRDDAAPQGEGGDELERIASQIEWDKIEWDEEYDCNSVSEDEEGPRIGQGAWVDGKWQDPLDPFPVEPRQSHSREEFDPDYEPEQRQVMHTRLNPYYMSS